MTAQSERGRSEGGLDAYYDEARSWSEDRAAELHKSRRLAWIVAIIAGVIALLEAIALVFLVPLKTAVPYMVMVDRQTGHVETLDPLDQAKVAPDAALTRSFLAQYVVARESYSAPAVRSDYRKVALWSADEARQQYLALMQPSNAASPFATLPRSAQVEVRLQSVSSLGPDTALVRFQTLRTDPGGSGQPAQAWAAVLKYRFSAKAMSAADRLDNPLGFQVVRYRRDAEMAPPTPTPSAAPQPADQVGSVAP